MSDLEKILERPIVMIREPRDPQQGFSEQDETEIREIERRHNAEVDRWIAAQPEEKREELRKLALWL